jgi:hypothetical protein
MKVLLMLGMKFLLLFVFTVEDALLDISAGNVEREGREKNDFSLETFVMSCGIISKLQ